MSSFEFSDGTRRLLRGHPALPAARTRELGFAFNAAQAEVCRCLASLGRPLELMVRDIREGRLPYFREGSDRDRKGGAGTKASYRFAGFTPGHVGEYELQLASRDSGAPDAPGFAEWEARFLMRFTFEVIEQVALRAFPCPDMPVAPGAGEAPLAEALSAARRLRDEILAGNLLLVAKAVLRRGPSQASILADDLFTAGTDGLLVAINRYDPSVGSFSTYAMPWMRLAMDRFVAKTRNVIRVPIGLQEKARRMSLEKGPGADSRCAQALLIPEVQSLEEPVPGLTDGVFRLEDVVADPAAPRPREAVERDDIARILAEGMSQLDGLKRFIIAMRNDVGDAAELGAMLFREEIALSHGRGRATFEAACKTADEPARVRMAGGALVGGARDLALAV